MIPDIAAVVALHGLVGIALIAIAFYSLREVDKTAAPARTERILKALTTMVAGQGIFGVILLLELKLEIAGVSITGRFVRLVIARALLAQSARSPQATT